MKWGLQLFMRHWLEYSGTNNKNIRKYKYLGSIITQDCKDNQAIDCNISQGETAIQQLNSLLWSTKLGFEAKELLYNSIVEPIRTCGARNVEINTKEKTKSRNCRNGFFKRSCRISRLRVDTSSEWDQEGYHV